MARPISHMETYLSQSGPDGVNGQNGRSMIPNGQPPQFGRQPMYPEKVARPMMGQHLLQNMPPATSNGIQQQYSHPSSLSSHSSRDASPVPHSRPPLSGPSSHQPSPSATPPPPQSAASQPQQFRQQLPPNLYQSPSPVRQPGRQMFRPPVAQRSQIGPSQALNQPPNIPNASDGQRFAPGQSTAAQFPPQVAQPNSATVQSNPAMSFAPPQSTQVSSLPPVQPNQAPNFAPMQPNQAPNYAPVQPNQVPNYAPVQPNQVPNYAPVQPNQAPNFAPVQPNQVPNFAPVQPNKAPSFAPPQTNPSFAPVQPNQVPSFAPVQSNQARSFAPSLPTPATNVTPVQQPNQALSFASGPPKQAPSFAPGQTNLATNLTSSQPVQVSNFASGQPSQIPNFAPAQSNLAPGQMKHGPSFPPAPPVSSYPPTSQANPPPRFAPPPVTNATPNAATRYPQMPTNTPQNYPPAPTNNATSYAPQTSYAPTSSSAQSFPPTSSAASFPPPSVPGQTVRPNGPPTSVGQPQSRMAPYGQTITTQPVPQGRPPGQNGPTPQYGTAPPQSRLPPPSGGQNDAGSLPKRYPQAPSQAAYNSMAPRPGPDANFNQQLAGLSVAQQGFSKLWGAEHYDLLQTRNILPPDKVEVPRVKLQQEFLDAVNCSPEIFRCTLTKIPETNALLQKSRLPLGVLIHPFKDLNHLAVIQCQSIVRCRACRTYINPFVYFVDHKRWKCNLCFRVNESVELSLEPVLEAWECEPRALFLSPVPEEFQFDPVSKTYGDPSRRPEIKSATIEFIAPSEYMLRPPQPAVYLFLLDVSCLAAECGYLSLVCSVLLDELDRLPGDARTQVGFIAYDTALRFYSLAEGLNQPQEMTVMDIDDVFLPCPDSLILNLNENKELVKDLLRELPKRFAQSHDSNSCLGAALQAAFKLMSATGGRVTVFQACLPNVGPGALASREDPSARAAKEVPHLNPATDFYKRLALDCSGQQVAVDLFIVNQQYCDLATLSGVSRFSGGSIHHFPLYKSSDGLKAEALEQSLRRYLTRKLGLEAVMRIRCSRGLAIHTFHGNFFVRSTDLLSLPNVNPDAGFAMQVAVEESLAELQTVCFQAALLYTSSKGERRIRVHTLCLPVAANLSDILHSADQQCIVGLLAKMAVDRSLQSSLGDAREAFINVAVDVLAAYKLAQPGASSALAAPHNMRLLPLYILALLKYAAFRTGQSTRLDDRVFAMCQMKTLPLAGLMQEIYPDLYPVHRLLEQATIDVDGVAVPQPPRLHLSAEKLESSGAFLLDAGAHMVLFIGRSVGATFCQAVFQVNSFLDIPEDLMDLPVIDTPESEGLRHFINHLQSDKPWPATLEVIRDDSQSRNKFYERLLEDRTESSLSYYEFLQHLKTNVK